MMLARSASVCFVDGGVNTSTSDWVIGVGIQTMICRSPPRRIYSSWIKKVHKVAYQTYGGVKNHMHVFYAYSQLPIELKTITSLEHSRDAHAIIDDSVWCYTKLRKPTILHLVPL